MDNAHNEEDDRRRREEKNEQRMTITQSTDDNKNDEVGKQALMKLLELRQEALQQMRLHVKRERRTQAIEMLQKEMHVDETQEEVYVKLEKKRDGDDDEMKVVQYQKREQHLQQVVE